MPEYIRVPTFDNHTKEWSHTAFDTREDFVTFLWSVFKEPGEYQFDETSKEFNLQARLFNKPGRGYYCIAPEGTADFINYWNTEKEKCRSGVIYLNNGKTWYLTRAYYMWLNFLPIFDKEEQKFGFAKIRDAQYHMALYECIAEHSFKHVAILKKRQIASSYFHAGVLINRFWFEEGFIGKMAGSLKDYVNEKGTWRFLDEYRNFLNSHTAWYRPCNPEKVLNWEQKVEVTVGGRKTTRGLKSVMIGLGLDKSPTNGVGGPVTVFFHEEAGIAPKMNETMEYLLPAMKSGMLYTGIFMAAGSVGDLDQCEPLKELILNPDSKDILAVPTKYYDEKGQVKICGLFIPEQWSMMPYIDEYGNSMVEKAIEAILLERQMWKKKLKPADYQLRISQKPINIAEAFAYRKLSKFPLHLLSKQTQRIDEKEYFVEYADLQRNADGKLEPQPSFKQPINEFPISPTAENKEGVLEIFERPDPMAGWGTYYASVDPVGEGKTTTSESLCSIYVLKNATETIRHKADGTIENIITPAKIVACWTGRFDDINLTHDRLEKIIEYYNAWTVVENNVSLFIQHMIARRKQKYLVPKNMIAFLKELSANGNVYQEYGWKNTGTLFKGHMLNYAIEFISEVIDNETDKDGNILKSVYGVERIPDKMILKEMSEYEDGKNVDRLVAFTALIAFAKVQQSNKGYLKKTEYETEKKPEKSLNNRNLYKSPFKHMGFIEDRFSTKDHFTSFPPSNSSQNFPQRTHRSPFKNLN